MLLLRRRAGILLCLLVSGVWKADDAAASSSGPSTATRRIRVVDPQQPGRRLPFSERPHQDSALSLSRSKLDRWRLRWRHRRLNRTVPQAKAKQQHQHDRKGGGWFGTAPREGTRLWLGRLAGERPEDLAGVVARLFGDDAGGGSAGASCPGRAPSFNHNLVGMTNPCLRIGSWAAPFNHGRSSSEPPSTSLTVPASTASKRPARGGGPLTAAPPLGADGGGLPDDAAWWPGTPVRPSPRNRWKAIVIRRRVGSGPDCYRRVRDAALQWEFRDGDVGIIAPATVPRGSPSTSASPAPAFSAALEDPDAFRPTRSELVQQLWSGPGRRRLVTYAAQPSSCGGGDKEDQGEKGHSDRTRSWLPSWRIVAFNPVGVVYDLVDQRGGGPMGGSTGTTASDTTTYTSTAYATLRGHWLQGEERVTVAWRHDGAGCDGGGSVDVELLSFSRPSPSSWQGRLLWPLLGGLQERFFKAQLRALERAAQAPPAEEAASSSASRLAPL